MQPLVRKMAWPESGNKTFSTIMRHQANCRHSSANCGRLGFFAHQLKKSAENVFCALSPNQFLSFICLIV
jgi:hypothetical protein